MGDDEISVLIVGLSGDDLAAVAKSCPRRSSPEGSPVRKGLSKALIRLLDARPTCLKRR